MEEKTVQRLIATETVEPVKRLNRSSGAAYIACIALIIGAIALANLFESRWQIPRYFVQPPLYALLVVVGMLVYRRHYVAFRYTLTDQTLAIERLAGDSQKAMTAVLLSDIDEISEGNTARFGLFTVNAFVFRTNPCVTVRAVDGRQKETIVLSPGEAFLEQLTAQWQASIANR